MPQPSIVERCRTRQRPGQHRFPDSIGRPTCRHRTRTKRSGLPLRPLQEIVLGHEGSPVSGSLKYVVRVPCPVSFRVP